MSWGPRHVRDRRFRRYDGERLIQYLINVVNFEYKIKTNG